MASEKIVRRHYLIPKCLVRKVHALSDRQKVSESEIVCRALDAYTGVESATISEDELVELLLIEMFETIEHETGVLSDLNHKMDITQRRIDDGEIRREAESDMHRWLGANPGAVAEFRKYAAYASIPRKP